MAALKETATGRRIRLEAEHLIGRAPGCTLSIDQRYVSAQHAVLRFNGESWEIRDLGSRNGTFLDNARLKQREERIVHVGSKIWFGKSEQQWELVDESGPGVMAVPLDGGEAILLDGELLALPSPEDPRATIYRNSDGVWVLEHSDSLGPITNLQTFEIEGRTYRFSCPQTIAKTSLAGPSTDVEMRHVTLLFSVSRDEEHVQLHATFGHKALDLGSRSHNYLLLTLARRRLEDAAEGLPETSCGWIYQEDLAHDPTMAPSQMNIDVFRIRKQFAALGIIDAANIVERRPRTRQLRIGVERLSVVVL
jgi:pSer/pThr/pTyr-binding forkhead associated (FHA) protein